MPKIYYNLLYFLPQNMTGPIMTSHPVKIINLISFRVILAITAQCNVRDKKIEITLLSSITRGQEPEMEFVAKRLTSKDLVFPLSSSKYSPPSSHAVSCREALPAYISLIKSKERRDHTHPILSAGFSVRFDRLSPFLFLPAFLPFCYAGLTLRLFYLLQHDSPPKPIPLSVRLANYTRS